MRWYKPVNEKDVNSLLLYNHAKKPAAPNLFLAPVAALKVCASSVTILCRFT